MPVGDARAIPHGGYLRDAHSGDDPRRADAPRTDPDLHGIDAGVDESLGPLYRRHIAGDDLHVREFFLRRAHGVDDAAVVAVRRVDDDDVDTGADESRGAFVPIRSWTDGGPDAEATLVVLDGQGVLVRLKDVLDRDEPDEFASVDDEQLLDAVFVQELLRLVHVHAGGDGHELLRHERADGLVEVLLEPDVSGGENPDGLFALDDGHSADVVLAHHFERRAQRLRWTDRDGTEDHPALGAFHAFDLAGLRFDRHVLVNDADPALAGHRDRGAALGDRVHRRGEERYVQIEAPAEPGLDVDVLRQNLAVRGDEQDVIERQALVERVIQHDTV